MQVCKSCWLRIPRVETLLKVVAEYGNYGMRLMVEEKAAVFGRSITDWLKTEHQIYMLVVYPKSAKDNLTDKETAILREFVKEL